MIVQEVMTVSTYGDSLRCEIYGWGQEDPSLFKPGRPIGMTGGPRYCESPGCILEAMSRGWRLLGPPQPFEQVMYKEDTNEKYQETHYEWWLVREKET